MDYDLDGKFVTYDGLDDGMCFLYCIPCWVLLVISTALRPAWRIGFLSPSIIDIETAYFISICIFSGWFQ